MPRFQPLDPATVDAMQRFVETTNDSYAAIGARLGVSASTVERYHKARGWRRPGEGLPGAVARAMRQAGGGVAAEGPSDAPGAGFAGRSAAGGPSCAGPSWARPSCAGDPSAEDPADGPARDRAPGAGAGPAWGMPGCEPAADEAGAGAARRRAVLDRLWAVVELQAMRLETASNAGAQAAFARDVALLVRVAGTLARVVRDWPPEPAGQQSRMSLGDEIAFRLQAMFGADPPAPEEMERA